MPMSQPKDLSAFGRQAVRLDAEFTELVRLSGQLQRLEIDSESGLERGVKLLEQFARHGQSISAGIQEFSRLLQDVREQSESAARVVAERSQAILERKQAQQRVREELGQIERSVKGINEDLSAFRNAGVGDLRSRLESLSVELKKFQADAQAVKETAGRSRFRSIERDAQNLLDALRSSLRRVDKAMAGR